MVHVPVPVPVTVRVPVPVTVAVRLPSACCMAIFLYGYFSVRGYITLRCMIILLQGFEVQLVERRRDREEREEAVRRSSIESVGQSQICNL